MPHPNPRIILPIVVVATLGIGGYYLEWQRERTRSVLSGFFESQPIEVASRISGRASRVLVKESDHVAAGEPPGQIEGGPAQGGAAAAAGQGERATEHGREGSDVRGPQ